MSSGETKENGSNKRHLRKIEAMDLHLVKRDKSHLWANRQKMAALQVFVLLIQLR